MRRIIQTGLGVMGEVWAGRVSASKEWEAAAYVDPNKQRLLTAAQRHGMPMDRCFTDLHAALQSVEAEALLDVSPPGARRAVCVEALDHGLDLLCEKPLADTPANARFLARRAEKLGRIFMAAHDYRYQAPIQTMKRFIAQGKLGAIAFASIQFHAAPRFKRGFRDEHAHPLLLDMAVHHVDLARYLFDADLRSVSATTLNPSWSRFNGAAAAMAHWRFDNGILAHYTGNWCATGGETSMNGDWRIEGARGVLTLANDDVFFGRGSRQPRKLALVRWPWARQDYLLRAFTRAINTREEPETSANRVLNALLATHAMARAAGTGRTVPVRDK